MIRLATLDDVPQLIKLAKYYFNKSVLFTGLEFCPEETARMCVNSIMNDNNLCLVYDNGEIQACVSSTFHKWFTKEVVALEDIFIVKDCDNRGIVAYKLAKEWLKLCLDNGAARVYTSNTAGYESEGYLRLMSKLGFNKYEGEFLVHE